MKGSLEGLRWCCYILRSACVCVLEVIEQLLTYFVHTYFLDIEEYEWNEVNITTYIRNTLIR